MKNSILKLLALSILLSISSCSSVKILNTWTSENVESIKSQNILIIARTANEKNRVAFEDEISKKLRAKGLNVTESYKKFPKINPNSKLTEERVKSIKKMLLEEGFNAVIVSVLKDTEQLSKTVTEGGYYTGESLRSYYSIYNVGFFGYYGHPISYPDYRDKGIYVEQSRTTQTAQNYILETAAYNLELEEKEQLLAVITSKIREPESIYGLEDSYVKAILKSLKKEMK